MSMCSVVSFVVGRGCLLWPEHSLGKTLLAFVLLHFLLQCQTCLLFQVSLDFLLLHSSPLWWQRHLSLVLVWNAVLACSLNNNRIISVHFQGKPFNITVIHIYAPTANTEEAEIKWFYEDLQDLLELTPRKDVLFITGDWNAKVGSQETPGVTGKFGLQVQNKAGQRIIEFCQENTLDIVNTLFQQQRKRLYTWTSPDGQHKNQIDYILWSQRWRSSKQSAKTRLGADCCSDHELLIAEFRLKLKKVGKNH